MGIICGITPGTMQQSPIRTEDVSAEKIKSIANVEIEYYKQSNNSALTITFEDLKIMKNIVLRFALGCQSYTGVVRSNANDTQRVIPW